MQPEIKVEDHLKLVHMVVHRFDSIIAALHIEYEDVFQIGCLGMLKSLKTFDPSKGAFTTHAVYRIMGDLDRHFRYLNRIQRRGTTIPLDSYLDADEQRNTLLDIIPDPRVDKEFETSLMVGLLGEWLASGVFSEREKQVLNCLFNDHAENQQEIADKLGIKQSWVSKILYRIKKKAASLLNDPGGYCEARA